MKPLDERIKNAIKFFRNYCGPDYDSSIFQKFFPRFLSLVEQHMNGGEPGEPETDLKVAEEIFNTKLHD